MLDSELLALIMEGIGNILARSVGGDEDDLELTLMGSRSRDSS
jgi:hypothetical protein